MNYKIALNVALTIILSTSLNGENPSQANATTVDQSSGVVSASEPVPATPPEMEVALVEEEKNLGGENPAASTDKSELSKSTSGWTCKGWIKEVLALKMHPAPGVVPLALTNSYTANVILISKIPEIQEALAAAREQRENDLPRECQNWIRQGLFNSSVKNNYYVDGAVIEVAEQMTKKINSQLEKENRNVYKALRKARRVQAVISDNIQNNRTNFSNALAGFYNFGNNSFIQ